MCTRCKPGSQAWCSSKEKGRGGTCVRNKRQTESRCAAWTAALTSPCRYTNASHMYCPPPCTALQHVLSSSMSRTTIDIPLQSRLVLQAARRCRHTSLCARVTITRAASAPLWLCMRRRPNPVATKQRPGSYLHRPEQSPQPHPAMAGANRGLSIRQLFFTQPYHRCVIIQGATGCRR